MTELDRTDEAGYKPAPSPDQALVQAVSIEVIGPLPHPYLLAEYDDAVVDGANRVVKLAEAQIHHRQLMETRGQVFTFALAMVIVLGGIALIALGDGLDGLAPLVAALAGLGGLFAYRGIRSHKTEQMRS